MDACLKEMERSEEFSKGVRLEMLAAAYGSKWTFPQSLSTLCIPQPFRPHASSSSFQIQYLLSVLNSMHAHSTFGFDSIFCQTQTRRKPQQAEHAARITCQAP
jgi:hypothetical protein